MENCKITIKKYRVFDIKYETDGCKIILPDELFIDLSLEPDEINDIESIDEMLGNEISDKTGYLHNGFSFEEISQMNNDKEKQKVFVVMIDDVCEDLSIQECTVWSTKSKAISQLKTVADSYKKDPCAQYLDYNLVGFSEDTNKEYVMTESEEHFTFYKNGYYKDNHIEVWILEKEID